MCEVPLLPTPGASSTGPQEGGISVWSWGFESQRTGWWKEAEDWIQNSELGFVLISEWFSAPEAQRPCAGEPLAHFPAPQALSFQGSLSSLGRSHHWDCVFVLTLFMASAFCVLFKKSFPTPMSKRCSLLLSKSFNFTLESTVYLIIAFCVWCEVAVKFNFFPHMDFP